MFFCEPCKTAFSAGRSLRKFSSSFQNARTNHQVQWPSPGGIAAVWPWEIWVCNGRRSRNHDFRGKCRIVRSRNPFCLYFLRRTTATVFKILSRSMNTQPVVVLRFTPSFLVMACQVWQPTHLNWLSITFIYLVCLSLETGKKSRVTSSDQRIIYFFNQLGNKNQTNHDLTHSHFPCLVFPFGDAFVFPRSSPLSCFPALGASGLISHHFWRRLNEKHEDSHDSTCTFMNE